MKLSACIAGTAMVLGISSVADAKALAGNLAQKTTTKKVSLRSDIVPDWDEVAPNKAYTIKLERVSDYWDDLRKKDLATVKKIDDDDVSESQVKDVNAEIEAYYANAQKCLSLHSLKKCMTESKYKEKMKEVGKCVAKGEVPTVVVDSTAKVTLSKPGYDPEKHDDAEDFEDGKIEKKNGGKPKTIPLRRTIVPSWDDVAPDSAVTIKLSRVRDYWKDLRDNDIDVFDDYFSNKNDKKEAKEKISDFYDAANKCLSVNSLSKSFSQRDANGLLDEVHTCLSKTAAPKFQVPEKYELTGGKSKYNPDKYYDADDYKATPKPTTAAPKPTTAAPKPTTAAPKPATAAPTTKPATQAPVTAAPTTKPATQAPVTLAPTFSPPTQTPEPYVYTPTYAPAIPVDPFTDDNPGIPPAPPAPAAPEVPTYMPYAPPVTVEPTEPGLPPSLPVPPAPEVPTYMPYAPPVTVEPFTSDEPGLPPSLPAPPAPEVLTYAPEPVYEAPEEPEAIQPNNALLPRFSTLDADKDRLVSPAELILYTTKLNSSARQVAAKGGDKVGVELLHNVIDYHYKSLEACTVARLARAPKPEVGAEEYPVLSSVIENSCNVKFRYSLLAGAPPFEFVAGKRGLVPADSVVSWFEAQLARVTADIAKESATPDAAELLVEREKFVHCAASMLAPMRSGPINRPRYYSIVESSVACAQRK